MAGITRVNGGVGEEGVLNGVSGFLMGASVKFYDIVVKANGGSARDLRPEMAAGVNGGLGGAVEAIMKVVPSGVLAYYVPDDANGHIYLVVDGHAAPAASTGSTSQPGLEEMIRALGATVGVNNMDVRGTDVTLGTGFTVV